MKRSGCALLVATLAALAPLVSHAAIITLSFDLNDIKISPTRMGQYSAPGTVQGASLTGTATAPVLTIPSGYYIKFGLDATVTDNNGLGLTGFVIGVNDSNSSIATAFPVSTVVNPYFTSAAAKGAPDGAGGVSLSLPTFGTLILGDTTTVPTFGANSPGELFNSMGIVPVANGTAVFSILADENDFLYGIVDTQNSVIGGQTEYINNYFTPGVDTFSPLPALTVNLGVVPEPTLFGGLTGAASVLLG